MINKELVKIFYEMADFWEMKGSDFRPSAYRKAASVLDLREFDIKDIYFEKGLRELQKIPGIGKNISLKIEEYIKTGEIKEHKDLKKRFPIEMSELTAIEGVGPKAVKVFFQELGIKNIDDLKKAAQRGEIAPLFSFGEKKQRNILEGIALLEKSSGRFSLGEVLFLAKEIYDSLSRLPETERISWAGSLRRRRDTIGDIDILISSANQEKIIESFLSLPGVIKVWGKGKTKISVRFKEGVDVDIRIVSDSSYGSALQYFTGSKEHNIALRKIAIEKGLKINEYGVFKNNKIIAGKSEEDVYSSLGMSFIPPEIRENRGEIELALSSKKLPQLVGYKEIKGDVHCHTNWSGGENSIEEMAIFAMEMGYRYIGISDHTKFLRIENGIDEKKLLEQKKEIEKINNKPRFLQKKFKILCGCEANILKDGSVDIKDEVLQKLDFVIAGIHSQFKMGEKEMTKRIITAIKNPYIDIISHPTGRIIKKREEINFDFEKILLTAKETGTVLEVNSSVQRLDLSDLNIKRALNSGVKLVINSDAHHKEQLYFIEAGIAQARRGWAEKKDIINTRSLSSFLGSLKRNKNRHYLAKF